jgi:signal transduction histidine kinase
MRSRGEQAGPADAGLSYGQLEHDLKTPLCAISAFVEILRDYPDLTPEERPQLLDRIVGESGRLLSTIERLLRRLEMRRILS